MKIIKKRGAILSLLLSFIFLTVKCQTTFNKRIDFYHTHDLCNSLLVEGDTIYIPIITEVPGIFNWYFISLNKLANNGILTKGSTFQKTYFSTVPMDIDKI